MILQLKTIHSEHIDVCSDNIDPDDVDRVPLHHLQIQGIIFLQKSIVAVSIYCDMLIIRESGHIYSRLWRYEIGCIAFIEGSVIIKIDSVSWICSTFS